MSIEPFETMQAFFNTIVNLGTTDKQSVFDRRRIRLLNTFALISAFILLIDAIINFLVGTPFYGAMLIEGLIFGCIPPLYFNHNKKYSLARHYFIIVSLTFIGLFSFGAVLSHHSRHHELVIVGYSALIVIICNSPSKQVYFFLSILLAIGLITTKQLSTGININSDTYVSYVSVLIAFSFIYFFTSVYKNDLLENITQLEKSRKEIEEQNEVLENKTEEILQINKQLEELNLTKDRFFSIISHDMKGPLNSLSAFSYLLLNHADKMSKGEIKDLAQEFNKSLNNSFNLLDNLLEWSRSQTGAMLFIPEKFDISNILRNNLELLQNQASNKNIVIKIDLVKKTLVIVDKNSINTVVRNLLSNAIKFTRKGGEIIMNISESSEKTIISIKDNGVGMSERELDKLFRMDVKHSTVGTAEEKGTGLGLMLCKEFVEKNGGEIWVASEEGKGSVFYFSIPSNLNYTI